MLGRGRTWLPALPLVVCAFLAAPASARAAGTGIYLQLAGGYGEWTGDEVVTNAGENNTFAAPNCCAEGTLAGQARLGFRILGLFAPEAVFFASTWSHGSDNAGGGFLGGGLRVFPLGILDIAGVIDLEGFPLEISLAATGAASLVASEDYQYDGWAFGTDLTIEYLLFRYLSLGLRVDFWFPSYDPFVVTSRARDQGLCLDAAAQPFQNDLTDLRRSSNRGTECRGVNGRGPSTTVISPQFLLTFRFDII